MVCKGNKPATVHAEHSAQCNVSNLFSHYTTPNLKKPNLYVFLKLYYICRKIKITMNICILQKGIKFKTKPAHVLKVVKDMNSLVGRINGCKDAGWTKLAFQISRIMDLRNPEQAQVRIEADNKQMLISDDDHSTKRGQRRQWNLLMVMAVRLQVKLHFTLVLWCRKRRRPFEWTNGLSCRYEHNKQELGINRNRSLRHSHTRWLRHNPLRKIKRDTQLWKWRQRNGTHKWVYEF
jgi:hypothetical protein